MKSFWCGNSFLIAHRAIAITIIRSVDNNLLRVNDNLFRTKDLTILPASQRSLVYPAAHVQVYLFTKLLQVAPFRHGVLRQLSITILKITNLAGQ